MNIGTVRNRLACVAALCLVVGSGCAEQPGKKKDDKEEAKAEQGKKGKKGGKATEGDKAKEADEDEGGGEEEEGEE